LSLWEVRGLKDAPEARLAPTVPELTRLPTPIPIHLRFLTGKQVEAELHPATLISLSPAGAEIITDRKLEIFSSLQLRLPAAAAPDDFLDGKVVGPGAGENAYIVRFSGLSDSTSAGIASLSRNTAEGEVNMRGKSSSVLLITY
jgi:hypothetical protein